MILDDGVCSVFAKTDVSAPGDMPEYSYQLRHQAWYGLLSFETSPANPTEYREERETAARIRILQCRSLHEQDMVQLIATNTPNETTSRFSITRLYHGTDDESGELITDITLEEVAAWS